MQDPFVREISDYIATNSSGYFTFGSGSDNLIVGELVRDVEGVFAKTTPSIEPDKYTPIQYHTIDFWAVYKKSEDAFHAIQTIYNLTHQAIEYYTDNYQVYFSHATGQPNDLDRDGQGRKMIRLSVLFIVRNLIS